MHKIVAYDKCNATSGDGSDVKMQRDRDRDRDRQNGAYLTV